VVLVDTKRFRVIARINLTRLDVSTPVEINGQTWMVVGDKLWHLSPDHDWQPDRAVDLHIADLRAGYELVAFGSLWIANLNPKHMQIIRVAAQGLHQATCDPWSISAGRLG
jgi:hypothetical protein